MANLTSTQMITSIPGYYNQKIVPFYPKLIDALIILVIGWIFILIVKRLVKSLFDKTPFDETIELFFYKLTGHVLWIILLLIILSTIGINIGPILAGLGIVAFIVGFAMKDTLSNIAAGLMLLAYRPFKIGDHIEAAKVDGIVKEVSVGACILLTEDKVEITIPNSNILGGPIKNFTRHKTFGKKSKKK